MIDEFDIIIIGSGIGGLLCGDILSREGYQVCVLEKNKQIGGCLQTYTRDKIIFDAGVHYLGSLGKGQNLYQLFKYLGITDKLKLQRMDEDVFDKIIIENDDNEYAFAQGYENFIQKLLAHFPHEEKTLRLYCERIKEVCNSVPFYNLRMNEGIYERHAAQAIDTKTFIESITSNKKLQAVLAGNNMLYAGQGNKTPFYAHAMILNSYIESSFKCIGGGSAIARIIAKNIKEYGGVVYTNTEVKKIIVKDGKASYVVLATGERIAAKYFIANMHPAQMLKIIDTGALKKAYTNRIENLENSISAFVINIVLKKDTFPHFRYNYYYHKEGQVWNMTNYTKENWPLGYAIFCSESSKTNNYAESLTILTYMKFEDVIQWQHTFNTISVKKSRGKDYEIFKKQKAEILLNLVEQKFPGLKKSIQHYYIATPLTYRDYMGTSDGSIYGIVKDYKDPLKTFISPRTQLPNLFLTGQNINLHGILGTAMSALVTCTAFMQNEAIIEKIRNA